MAAIQPDTRKRGSIRWNQTGGGGFKQTGASGFHVDEGCVGASPDQRQKSGIMHNTLWLAVGLAGQIMFTSRFLVQWITSERRGASVVPTAFWWLSVAGGLTLLAYSFWRMDPVFILGQSMGLVVYARNLMLIRRGKVAAS